MDLLAIIAQKLTEVEHITQVYGYIQRGEEGLHIIHEGKQYLLTIRERPSNDGGMILYEINTNE
jgi:hypothetical protein